MTHARLAIAPLVVVAIAVALWWLSDRLVTIGPIDRATFGWVVVAPLWAAAPAFAGFAWRATTSALQTRFALVSGLVIGSATTALLWTTAIAVDCAPTHTPIELLPQALLVGALIGGGFFLACRLASREVSLDHVGRGVIYGAVIQLVAVPAAFILSFYAFYGLCQRP